MMKPTDQKKAGLQKVLDAPINLAEMAANAETYSTDVSSIWVINRDDNLVCKYLINKLSLYFILIVTI